MTEREVSCKDLTPLVSGLRGWFWPRESVLTACSKAIVAESSVPTVHLSHRHSASSPKLCADRPSIA